MKVAIITERLLTGFGVDVVVHQQASGLIQAGYTVLVFVLKYDPILFGKTNYQIIDQKDMNLHERIAQIKAAKPEIAIAHTPCGFELLPYLSPFMKTIVYDHGTPTPSLVPKHTRKVLMSVIRKNRRFVYPNVHEIIAISRFIDKETHVKYPVKIIYNGSDHLYKKFPISLLSKLTLFISSQVYTPQYHSTVH